MGLTPHQYESDAITRECKRIREQTYTDTVNEIMNTEKSPLENVNQPYCLGAVISRLFSELALKHNVKIDNLNLHISNKTLYIQEYTPGGVTEYSCLEMVDLNGL